ncbi:MAG: RDD family protein [Candidatus Electryonea clarkiae]|nr:RDD family protein [Candidatus Electryonea clarkiae]MDP8285940.1 RDD family protein [Candidatus Electryonea clarkiae]
MSRIDRYIAQVMRNIFASPDDKKNFASDLQAHIDEAMSNGDTEATVLRRMGEPEDIATEFMSDVKLQYANYFERLVAFIIDLSVCFSVTVPLFFIILFSPSIFSQPSSIGDLLYYLTYSAVHVEKISLSVGHAVVLGAFIISTMGLYILYFPLLEYRFGKTLGKHLMRLRVVREWGAEPGLGYTFIRRFSYFFDIIALDSIFIFFTEKRQRAFDIVAKTVVVRETFYERSVLSILAIFGLLALLGILVIIPLIFVIGKDCC